MVGGENLYICCYIKIYMLGRVEILGLINNICTFLILLDAIRLIL